MGKGFPVDSIPPSDVHTVLIFATGSGACVQRCRVEGPGQLLAGRAGGNSRAAQQRST